MEVQHVVAIESPREETPPGLQSGVELHPVAREIQVARTESVRPEARAERPPDDALAQREIFGEYEMLGVDVAIVGKRPAEPARVGEEAENSTIDEGHPRRHGRFSLKRRAHPEQWDACAAAGRGARDVPPR
jgi:hypothetical protein